MVENTGETLRAGAYKPLNAPQSLQVEEDAAGAPLAIMGKRRQRIEAVDACWRIDDEWWRAELVSRLYFTLRLATGQKLVLYKDLVTGSWYRQSY